MEREIYHQNHGTDSLKALFPRVNAVNTGGDQAASRGGTGCLFVMHHTRVRGQIAELSLWGVEQDSKCIQVSA